MNGIERYYMSGTFEKTLQPFWNKVKNHNVLTLSTSSNNRVSSRQVSVIIHNEKFYFQTNENFLKFRQISENPNAALNFKSYSIEGKCRCIGKPDEPQNAFFLEFFREHYYIAYKLYSCIVTERLIEFSPTLIYNWGYEKTKPFMEYWDFEKHTYTKEYKG